MPKKSDDSDDVEAFLNEMADVTPLPPDTRGRIPSTPRAGGPPAGAPAATAVPVDDLREPDGDFAAPGVSRDDLKKLRRGDHRAQDRLDLHGMTLAAAVAHAGRFLDESLRRGYRCVCIVHGRGVHSEGNFPVLKAGVRAHLRSQRSVLAFTDAPKSDGGTGAAYVLLRRSS